MDNTFQSVNFKIFNFLKLFPEGVPYEIPSKLSLYLKYSFNLVGISDDQTKYL